MNRTHFDITKRDGQTSDCDWEYALDRVKMYCRLDGRVPSTAVSIYESICYRLYQTVSGIEATKFRTLPTALAVVEVSPNIKLITDLFIGEKSVYFEAVVEETNILGEVVHRERFESTEDQPFESVSESNLRFWSAFHFEDVFLEFGPTEPVSLDCVGIQGNVLTKVSLPGNHEGLCFRTIEKVPKEETGDFSPARLPLFPMFKSLPPSEFSSPSIVMPDANSWRAACALTNYEGVREVLDGRKNEWDSDYFKQRYADFGEESKSAGTSAVESLRYLINNIDSPVIFIAETSPFYHRGPLEEMIGDLEDNFSDWIRVVRVTWPAQLAMQSFAPGDSFLPHGSVRVCFPKWLRDEKGFANILITSEDIVNDYDTPEFVSLETAEYWSRKLYEILDRAYEPCLLRHPQYLRLRETEVEVRSERRLREHNELAKKWADIEASRQDLIKRWEESRSAEKYDEIWRFAQEIFENWEATQDERDRLRNLVSDWERRYDRLYWSYRTVAAGNEKNTGNEFNVQKLSRHQRSNRINEIPEWCDREFHDNLIMLPRAKKALSKGRFMDPELICKSLELAANEVRKSFLGKPGSRERLDDQCRQIGVEFGRSISKTVAGNHREHYYVKVGSRELFLEWHIKYGVSFDPKHCMRIYLCWDDESKKVVIGSLPFHLPSSLS